MSLTFTCSFRTAAGARRVFHIQADNWDHAEALLEDIAVSARVDGELIEEGECDAPFEIGHA